MHAGVLGIDEWTFNVQPERLSAVGDRSGTVALQAIEDHLARRADDRWTERRHPVCRQRPGDVRQGSGRLDYGGQILPACSVHL